MFLILLLLLLLLQPNEERKHITRIVRILLKRVLMKINYTRERTCTICRRNNYSWSKKVCVCKYTRVMNIYNNNAFNIII